MNIRNFCIIAHIDHGKSTLADRMLEITGTIRKSEKHQVLDRMDLEQERGITIKLTPARMQRKGYEFNLIDTPGHVDFQYEVSRSLAAVEGVILLIDASQGIQAQTLSTLYQAIDQNLEIIPVLNKIDLPAANPDRVAQEIENLVGIDKSEIIAVSGKTGQNVELLLDRIIEKIKDPVIFKEQNPQKFLNPLMKGQIKGLLGQGDLSKVSRALIFDSVYDTYKGVVSYIKVVDGHINPGEKVELAYSNHSIIPTEVGHFSPEYTKDNIIKEGQIGYIVTGEKSVRDVQIGDTFLSGLTKHQSENKDILKGLAIPGFRKSKPFVYAGVYPMDSTDYDKLKDSLEKLSLNDSSIEYTMEDSKALGLGFRCGFLGMLHMDIIKERLSREFDLETIFTTPTVVYLVKSKTPSIDKIKSGANITELAKTGYYKAILLAAGVAQSEFEKTNLSVLEIIERYGDILKLRMIVRAGSDITEQGIIDEIHEPLGEIEIVGPQEYAGEIMKLCQSYRGEMQNMEHIDQTRVVWKYLLPMGEIIIDFYDKLKSATKGYATMNYEFKKYQRSDLVKLDIFLNGEKIEALSMIIHKANSMYQGRDIVKKLKELIPRHMFVIPIQAGIGNKMIARENIPALKKDVIAKCYGGDISRKRKLLAKQKEGKKKMKAMGSVNVPGDVFIKMVAK